jgi:NTP pyrophosphatase (non-canonical NTP hydrolase)
MDNNQTIDVLVVKDGSVTTHRVDRHFPDPPCVLCGAFPDTPIAKDGLAQSTDRLGITSPSEPVGERAADLNPKSQIPHPLSSQPSSDPLRAEKDSDLCRVPEGSAALQGQDPRVPHVEGCAQAPVGLTFDTFSAVNRDRCERPDGFNHALHSWSTSDWFLATVGELGEAANIAKKLNRYRDGIPGNKETEAALRDKLRKELGDVFVYLDLLAQSVGVSIGAAAVEVFNAKSDEIGCPVRMPSSASSDPLRALIEGKAVQWRAEADRGEAQARSGMDDGLKLTAMMLSGMVVALREKADELEALLSLQETEGSERAADDPR